MPPKRQRAHFKMLSNKRTLLNKDRLVDVKDDELPIAEALYAHRGGRSSVDDVCDKEWEERVIAKRNGMRNVRTVNGENFLTR